MWADYPPAACEWSQPWYGMYTSRPVQLIIPGSGQDVGGMYRTVSVSAYVRTTVPNLCRYIHALMYLRRNALRDTVICPTAAASAGSARLRQITLPCLTLLYLT
jgi:hypothetical protein